MNQLILKTERLILRPITIEDAEDIFEYSKLENVGSNAGWKPHENLNETKEIMEQIFIEKSDVFGIVLKQTNKLFGSLGLINDPKRENEKTRMLGYSISENYWGQGYMTEAAKEIIRYGFEELHLDLISAYCYSHNKRSKRVVEKCGFSYEGKLILCEKLYNGKVYDNECYALLKS